jgi:large subunit ribosomal protein L3
MTQIYAADGNVIRCTVVQAGATVVGKRTKEKDGYTALVLGMGDRKEKHTAKAQVESAKKAGVPLRKVVKELRCDEAFAAKYAVGATLPIDEIFEEGQHIDVQGITRGRGFTGVMRRWNFSGFRATHGTHEYRRHGGSIGTNMTPGRTLPNLKMPGHYGDETVSILNVKVAKIMKEEGLLLIEGGVPGAKHGFVVVRGAVKKKNAGKKSALVLRSQHENRPQASRLRGRFSFGAPKRDECERGWDRIRNQRDRPELRCFEHDPSGRGRGPRIVAREKRGHNQRDHGDDEAERDRRERACGELHAQRRLSTTAHEDRGDRQYPRGDQRTEEEPSRDRDGRFHQLAAAAGTRTCSPTSPKRRSRRLNSRSARSSSSAPKSGHCVSVK